jgi:hypothetical protein
VTIDTVNETSPSEPFSVAATPDDAAALPTPAAPNSEQPINKRRLQQTSSDSSDRSDGSRNQGMSVPSGSTSLGSDDLQGTDEIRMLMQSE